MSISDRKYSRLDQLIGHADQALRTVFGKPPASDRVNPAATAEDTELAPDEQRLAARLMRVNHTGEVCAQALYQGQALTARQHSVQSSLQQAAEEENDHLLWCEQRIDELGGRASLLNPIFYAGSFGLGAIAGALGDRWNLGFLAETERQVVRHLEKSVERLPPSDFKSRAILATMKEDEAQHAINATAAGGAKLPQPVRLAMTVSSKVMTKSSYWV